MDRLAASFRLLADPTRLRILRLVQREELNAGELTDIVGTGQSTVSRHVALLRDAGLVRERREGRFAFYALAPEATAEGSPWRELLAGVRDAEDEDGDLARLHDALRARREDDGGSPDGAAKAPFVPGRSWAAWARALTWVVPRDLRALDVGCGDGALTLEIARFAKSVVGIDRNGALVARAQALAARRGVRHAKFEKGDAAALRFRADSFDLVVLSQTLHHLDDPAKAVAEAARVLGPRGRVLVLDLLPHGEDWVREKLGHRHLGFAPERLDELLRGVGFVDVEVEREPTKARERFRVVLATGTRPAQGEEPR